MENQCQRVSSSLKVEHILKMEYERMLPIRWGKGEGHCRGRSTRHLNCILSQKTQTDKSKVAQEDFNLPGWLTLQCRFSIFTPNLLIPNALGSFQLKSFSLPRRASTRQFSKTHLLVVTPFLSCLCSLHCPTPQQVETVLTNTLNFDSCPVSWSICQPQPRTTCRICLLHTCAVQPHTLGENHIITAHKATNI